MVTRSTLGTALSSLLAFACVLIATSAAACPAGTRFSVRPDGGNPVCIVIGQGLTVAVRCFETKGVCPAEHSTERSNNAPGRKFCCPTGSVRDKVRKCVIRGTAPFCAGECLPGEFFAGRFATGTHGCATGHKVRCCNMP